MLITAAITLCSERVNAQCFQIKDPRNGNQLTSAPKKNFACLTANSPRNATVFRIEFGSAASNIQMNWGDGSPVQNVSGPTTSISYTYPDTGIFNYEIRFTGCPTAIKGIFINQYNVRSPGIGFIFPPAGAENKRCLPADLVVTNASPGMNGFTEYLIDWGGQEKRDTVDFRSFNQPISHTYKKETKICRTRMTVTYRNLCGLPPNSPPLSQSAGDYFFISRDTAYVQPSKIVICEPENILLTDNSKLHCLDTSGRKILWRPVQGFNQTLPRPGDNTFRTYNSLPNKRLTIPAALMMPIPPDSLYRVEMQLKNQCGTDTADIEIRIAQPATPVFTALNNNICPGQSITFRNETPNRYEDGILKYEWNFGDGTPVVLNNNPTVEHQYDFGGTYRVILTCFVKSTISNNVCKKTREIMVTVKPSVTPVITTNARFGCESALLKIQNQSVNTQNVVWKGWWLDNAPSRYAGSGRMPSASILGSDTSEVAIRYVDPVDGSVTVAYKRPGRYVITLKAESAGCPEFTDADTVDVYPSPTVRWNIPKRKICVGSQLLIRDSSIVYIADTNGLPANYRGVTWKLNMGDGRVYQSSSPVNAHFDNVVLSNRLTAHVYARPGTYMVKLSVSSGFGACLQTDSIQVVVQPSPLPKFSFRRENCNSSLVTLTNLTTDSSTYYEYAVFRGQQHTISYYKQDRTQLNITLPYVPPGDSTFYQIYLRTYTILNGDTCINASQPVRVGVAPAPFAAFDVTPSQNGCHPMAQIVFANTSVNMPADPLNRFLWTFGRNGTSTLENPPPQTFTNTSAVLRIDTVYFHISRRNGCTFRAQKEILVFPAPNAQIIAPDSICSGVNVQLTATGNNISSYDWRFTDYDNTNTFAPAPVKRFENFSDTARTVTIELTARTINNCPQTVSKRVRIFPQPRVEISLSTNPDQYCSPLPVRFSYQNVSGATRFNWRFSNGDSLSSDSARSFVKAFTNNTGFTQTLHIQMVASNGGSCTTSVDRTMNLLPRVEASFNLDTTSMCSPAKVIAMNTSSPGSDRLTWQIGNNLTQNQQLYSPTLVNGRFDRDSTISIYLIASNSASPACRDTAVRTLRVHPKPIVNGITIPQQSACSPFRTSLIASASGAGNFTWDFGDGNLLAQAPDSVYHEFENFNPTVDRIYHIRAIGQNQYGCSDTASRSLAVKSTIKAGIVSIDSIGCTPFTSRFSSAASVNANQFEWSFGGFGSSNNAHPSFTFQNDSDTAQQHQVMLVARKQQVSGCADTAYQTVTVYPKPQADFSLSQTIGCGPLPVTFRNTSIGADRVQWVFSSGGASDTINSQVASFDSLFNNRNSINRTIRVDLYAFNRFGCSTKKTQFITVYADLTAEIAANAVEGCHPMRISFANNSSNFGGTWQWSFGDGNSSSVKNPEHVFNFRRSGDTTYKVKLTSIAAIGGCIKSDSLLVRVHGRPEVRFSLDRQRLQLPQNTIAITNSTPFPSDWRYTWNFGDGRGDTSRANRFTHTYNFGNEDFTDTNFVVQVIARGDYGCSDTLGYPIVIQPEAPKPAFSFSDSIGCSPLSVAFFNNSAYGREYYWDFGDRGISTEKHPVHVFTEEGNYTVTLRVSGFGGTRTLVKQEVITVRPFPRATFFVQRYEITVPEEPARFRPDIVCWECEYQWDFGDGTTDTAKLPTHYYKEPGIYKVSLMVKSPSGCSNYYERENAVKAVNDNMVLVPNVFKPSMAGPSGGFTDPQSADNTIFYPYTQGAKRIKLLVFNRWGQMLYQSTTLNKGWDGYLPNGSLAPADTYAYMLEVELATGEVKRKIGDVTILY